MRTYLILAVLCFNSLLAFSQKLNIPKASPFTAVKWEKDLPVVQFDNEWYHLEKLAHLNQEEILAYCKQQFGPKWQKRFSEDLVEVLQGIGFQPDIKVVLQLSKDGVLKTYTGQFTAENRRRLILYNKAIEESTSVTTFPQKISRTETIADLKQFEDLLHSISSYSQLSSYDYQQVIKKMADSIANENQDIDINTFANHIGKIMAEIGDRHSSIKNETFNKKDYKTYNLKLPLGIASLNGKMVALKKNVQNGNYNYYYKAYPNIKSINGIAVETLINTYNYRDKNAPAQAKLARGSSAIQKYGELLFANNMVCSDSVKVIFGNGSAEKTEIFHLTNDHYDYVSKLLQEHHINRDKISKKSFTGLSKIISSSIGYLQIPEMYSYSDTEGLESFIKNAFRNFSATKSLIIDIRNNPGGGREILQTCAAYLVQPSQSPWMANIAYLRTDSNVIGDEQSMSSRYLYSYNSKELSVLDRKAIDDFEKNFKVQKAMDKSKFSHPFYMVLHHGEEVYRQPVYILVNEESFSAASVFASAFKGLPNVKIVGETTDGSSGNSRIVYLKNSKLRINVSTMLSFQRNGTTLDGNGTIPDILIQANEKQVLNGYDHQLHQLINIINGTK